MSKRNQRWGKAITAVREAGPDGATALAIANAVLKGERYHMATDDKIALGLSLGSRLVDHRMAVMKGTSFAIHPGTSEKNFTRE